MYIKARIKKAAAIAAAFIITLSVMGGAANKSVDLVSATPDEYKARLAKLDEKQEELDKKINAKAEDIEAQVEKLDAINEQISTVEEKMVSFTPPSTKSRSRRPRSRTALMIFAEG